MAPESHGEKTRMIWPFLPFNWFWTFSFADLIQSFWLLRDDPSPILFYFYFFIRSELIRVDPSWSDPDWRSELIWSDFCTCLLYICIYIYLPPTKISHFTVANRIIKYFLFLLLYRQQMVLQKVRSKSKVVLHKYPPYAPFNWNPSPLTPWSPWS